MKNVVDKAIVLRRVNYGEKDRVVTFMSSAHGKVSLFAKSVRAQKSKLSAGIELLNICEIGFIEAKSNLKTLTSSQVMVYNNQIVKYMDKTNLCFESLKKVNDLVEENEGSEYFEPLQKYLIAMNDSSFDYRLVHVWFNFRIMSIAGVLSEMAAIESSSEFFVFDFDSQQFIAKDRGVFSKNDIKLLRLLRQSPKPIRLAAECGSEDSLLDFSISLLNNNLA